MVHAALPAIQVAKKDHTAGCAVRRSGQIRNAQSGDVAGREAILPEKILIFFKKLHCGSGDGSRFPDGGRTRRD